ncbi:MAG: hypothetical protein FJY42_06035 [Betaproteobacteria bacterium]|nr:hypothetical protein [Betaproteobacteria bacterium]
MPSDRPPRWTGLAQALGFGLGALGGLGVGQSSGLDLFAPGLSVPSLGGVILIGLGAGLGRRLARRWAERIRDEDDRY